MKYKLCVGLLILIFGLAAPPVQAEPDPAFSELTGRLVNSGFDRNWIETVFDEPCMTLYPKALSLRLTVREYKIDYAQFLAPDQLENCRKFMADHEAALSKAEERYGVPGEVLTAILLLETRLGTYTGKFETLRTLASQTVSGDRRVAAQVYAQLPDADKRRYTPQSAAARLGKRGDWFYGELKAFLNYLQKTGDDPCEVKGSYTGAIGLCQFQPSNIKPYGRDGNDDGVVDLFDAPDALMSAAAYLSKHGWDKGLSRAGRERVVKTYNHSRPYARTILDVAERIGPGQPEAGGN
jgi:membrane-bound lytic murein transglycosylase B